MKVKEEQNWKKKNKNALNPIQGFNFLIYHL